MENGDTYTPQDVVENGDSNGEGTQRTGWRSVRVEYRPGGLTRRVYEDWDGNTVSQLEVF